MKARLNKLLRKCLKTLGVSLYYLGLARWVIGLSKQRVRAVLYHAVEDQQSSYTKGLGITVSPATFALHLDYYQRFYTVISTNELLHKAAQPASLLISFDDGYDSVHEYAAPLLKERNLPAIVYLIGSAVRGRMVWVNRLNQALNSYPTESREVLSCYPGLINRSRRGIIHYIQTRFEPHKIEHLVQSLELSIPGLAKDTEKLFSNRQDILAMQSQGMEFGFHSNDHYNLGKCKDSELVAQLDTSGLEPLINSNTFAYPFGYFAPSAIGRLSRQGYEMLMTVGSNNDQYSELHMDRSEIFEQSFAQIFARLEIEEPIISLLRRAVSNWKSSARLVTGKRGESLP